MAATRVDTAAAGASSADSTATARSPDVAALLRARYHQVTGLRRDLVLGDLASTLVVVGLAMAGGRGVAAGMSAAVLLAVMAQVGAAGSPRSIVAVRHVLRAVMVLGGTACVLVALVGSPALGREAVLGAACTGVALAAVRSVARLPRPAARYGLNRRGGLLVGDPRALERSTARRNGGTDAAATGGAAATSAQGEAVLVTRGTRRGGDGRLSDRSTDAAADEDQRREHPEPNGPNGLVTRVVSTALGAGVERVTVLPGDSWGQRELRELSWLLEGTGIDMVVSTNLDGIAPHRVDVTSQGDRLMIRIGSASPRGTRAVVKSALDRLVATVLLVLSAPLLVLIAAAVRLESPGPAVFRQTRVREGGITFTMYKFRTMTERAEEQLSDLQERNMHGPDRPLFKMQDDPRITRVGHLLRQTSLDELPQLVNVLIGQMSLIGPRPALPLEVAMYDHAARRRLAVKPGMTGLWQVSGRSRLTWEESIGFDLDYVDNWSPSTDAAIAVRTFRAVVSKDGAF
jgi:lipopolysaccharide/colanic/teichoic acid biosynthesis glycosyltransferase